MLFTPRIEGSLAEPTRMTVNFAHTYWALHASVDWLPVTTINIAVIVWRLLCPNWRARQADANVAFAFAVLWTSAP